SYAPGEAHNHPLREFLYPVEQTVKLCRMQYLPPFVVHGVLHIAPAELEAAGEQYKSALLLLQQGRLTPAAWQQVQYLNELL
ncbi:MAG TPA: NAD(P)H-dependent oxidoreductase, partial [Chitinophaga sp.]